MVLHEPGEAENHLHQRLGVAGRRSAVVCKQRRALDLAQHPAGLGLGHRDEAEGDVLEKLDPHAPEAEHQRRAELLVSGHAEDDLEARLGHWHDEEVGPCRLGQGLANPAANLLEGRRNGLRAV